MSTNYISQITATDGVTYDVQEGVTTRIFRATCSTATSTAAKVATLDDATGYSLAEGVRVAVTFTYGNSADTPTLNVNSGGAKTIVIPTTTISTNYSSDKSYTSWGQYETIIFTYNGTYWITSGSSYMLYKAASTKTSLSDYTDGSNYSLYIPFTNLSGSNGTLTSAHVSPNFKIVDSQTNHLATLNLGNDLGSNETTYRRGALRLYSQTGKYIDLETKDTLSTNGTIYFPDYINNNATIATTEEIPTETTVSGWGFTKNTGTLTGVTFAGTSMSVSSGVASITQANARTALGLAIVATSGSYNDLSNKPTIPTKTSDLTNDSGFLTTDEKLKVEELSNNTTYSLILSGGSSIAATKNVDSDFKYVYMKNDTGTGSAKLTIGNSTASGTAGNKQGQLILYGSTAYAHTIVGAPTSNRTITLPNNTGTLALTTDIVDEKVKQENTTGTDTYRILFSYNANDNTETVAVRKSKDLKFTTSTGNLQTIQLNGVTVGSSPKFTDTVTTVTSSGSGNVVTGMTASNGAITYTMGTVSTMAAQIIRW